MKTRIKDLSPYFIAPNKTVGEAITKINSAEYKFALVIDDKKKLLATVTDGDIRRGLVRGLKLTDPLQEILIVGKPIVGYEGTPTEALQLMMRDRQISFIPVVDESWNVKYVELAPPVIDLADRTNAVFIMAGGMGTRLGDLTKNCPKPLLPLGGKPIIERLIRQFSQAGFKRFYISVFYKAEMIKQHFGDGSKLNVAIEYMEETEPLGTAGGLSLVNNETEPLIVINGDVLTKINFSRLLDFHMTQNSMLTVCSREYNHDVPYGVLETTGYYVNKIAEKPNYKFFINAGIYVIHPEILKHLKPGERTDMPWLVNKVVEARQKVCMFPVHEYWVDIGNIEDYKKAGDDLKRFFNE